VPRVKLIHSPERIDPLLPAPRPRHLSLQHRQKRTPLFSIAYTRFAIYKVL